MQTEVAEGIKTQILYSVTLFRQSSHFLDSVEIQRRTGRNDNIIRLMRIARWLPKAANTHTEYVILIAFSLHQCLHERASILRYPYISCLVTHLA